jgi:replication factor C small subunit
MARLPWAIAHRPKSAKDFVFQNDKMKELVVKFIEEQNIPHLLLVGHRGTGKTSLVNVLKTELDIDDMDYMTLNASDENSVDTIRNKIKSFINTHAMSAFKLVFLDEADYLTPQAQAVLRNMMEEYADNARFVLTGNKAHKIIPELKSRCQEIVFKTLNKDDVFKKTCKILKKEGVDLSGEDVGELIYKYIDATFPDFRKLLNTLEQNTINGVLQDGDADGSPGEEFNFTMMEMMNNGQWGKIRSFMAENTPDDQWDEVYRFMYATIGEINPFSEDALKQDEAIVTIADHLYKSAFVADQEINFAACVIKLSRIAKR